MARDVGASTKPGSDAKIVGDKGENLQARGKGEGSVVREDGGNNVSDETKKPISAEDLQKLIAEEIKKVLDENREAIIERAKQRLKELQG